MKKGERRISDPAFAALCEAYYIDNPGGGNLHIVLDEGGVSDECLYLCMAWAVADADWMGIAIADEMLRMDEADRQAYEDFVNARATRRGRGEPDEPYPTFSLIPPVIRG